MTDILGDNLTAQPGVPPKPVKSKGMGPAEGAKTRRIMVEENPDIPPTGLYVGHNGYGYLIKPGVIINAPEHLIEILDHAVTTVAQIDPQTLRVTGYRDRLRFSYRNVREAA